VKLIVGLGNPGKKYERTRHNVGFLVVDAVMDYDRNKWIAGKGPFQINKDPFQNGGAVIAKPDLFMNGSGTAVRLMLDQFQVSSEQCLVIVDDVNLPVGKIRFRPKGSAGGHHGLESIVQVLGTENFPRLRIGVGNSNLSGQDLTDFVLGEFSKQEWELLIPEINRARQACLEWVRDDVTTVMQRYNG